MGTGGVRVVYLGVGGSWRCPKDGDGFIVVVDVHDDIGAANTDKDIREMTLVSGHLPGLDSPCDISLQQK